MKTKFTDTLIDCPQCGKSQSKKAYIEECCWNCGSIFPLPEPVQSGMDQPAPTPQEEWQPDDLESKIKKMSEY